MVCVMWLSMLTYSQSGNLTGTVADENGAVVSGISIRLLTNNRLVATDVTKDDGTYRLPAQYGKYQVEFLGDHSGFRTAIVENVAIKSPKTILDIKMEVDLDSATTIYSEFVCTPQVPDHDLLDCAYVSRQGKGTTTPKIIYFKKIKGTN